jgi:hypothetical protein
VGLPLNFESPHWSEFATEGATLALHMSDAAASANDDPKKSPAGRCKPGFGVANLAEFHARMVEMNVPCLSQRRGRVPRPRSLTQCPCRR